MDFARQIFLALEDAVRAGNVPVLVTLLESQDIDGNPFFENGLCVAISSNQPEIMQRLLHDPRFGQVAYRCALRFECDNACYGMLQEKLAYGVLHGKLSGSVAANRASNDTRDFRSRTFPPFPTFSPFHTLHSFHPFN